MIVIDGKDTILGRLASFVAKKAMLGEEVIVLNSNEVIVSGKREMVFQRYKEKRDRGTHSTGPFYPRYPEQIVKRTIRNMLPYKQPKGRDALKRVKCFRGAPAEYAEKAISLDNAKKDKLPTLNYVTLAEIGTFLGAKL